MPFGASGARERSEGRPDADPPSRKRLRPLYPRTAPRRPFLPASGYRQKKPPEAGPPGASERAVDLLRGGRRVDHLAVDHDLIVVGGLDVQLLGRVVGLRSEERRVGEEGRSRWSPYH